MSGARQRALFGGLVGLLAGIGAAVACVALGRAVLDGARGLAVAIAASAAIGALASAAASARAPGSRRFSARAPFAAVAALATCALLRRVGVAHLNLYALGAGAGPWGQLALASLPLVGLATGVVAELDADPAR